MPNNVDVVEPAPAVTGDTTVDYGQRLYALFTELRQLPAERRQEFLDRVCAGRDSLRAELEGLLAEDGRAVQEGFLTPPDSLDRIAHRLRVGLAAATGETPEDTLIGRRLGPYEICDFIASGGMGSVYRATRVDDFRQVVALKLIRGGLGSDELFRRFTTERQVLADLNHPHIARLLDGGTTPENWPYFVMEFIDGQPIHRYCDQHQKTVAERARLVHAVCEAVQYAHERGVIHRDIKPANILVSAAGMPKLTDFGLAKQLDDDAGHTQTGQVLGTPNYMAPEQAKGQTAAIGPATDVYALGAILYELLAGRPPFKGATLPETLEQVCSQDPVPPRRLQPTLPRDLETICLKCLEKEPAKRYATAAALGDDLRRFLAGEPIQARPISHTERALRWCRRNKRVAGLLALLIVVVVGSIIGLANLWLLAEAGEAQAVEERNKARRQRDRARELLHELTKVAEGKGGLATEPGMQKLQLYILRVALKNYTELALEPEIADDPEFQQKTAQAYYRVARLCNQLGENEESEVCFRQAIAVWTELSWKYPEVRDYPQGLHGCYNNLALLLWHSNPQESKKAREQALACAKDLVQRFPDNPWFGDLLANEHVNLAVAARNQNDKKSAQEHTARAIAISRKLYEETKNPFFALQRANAFKTLGSLMEDDDNLDKAREAFDSALQLKIMCSQSKIADLDPVDREVGLPFEVAEAHGNLARILQYQRQSIDAIKHLRESLRIVESLATNYEARYAFRLSHAGVHGTLAEYLLAAGDEAEARKEYARSIDLWRGLWDSFPEHRTDTNQRLLATLCLFPLEWRADAPALLERARKSLGPPETPLQHSYFGMASYRLGEWAKSVPHLKQGFDDTTLNDMNAGFFLAMAYAGAGEQDMAKKYFELADRRLGGVRDLGARRLRDEAAKLVKLK